jgi:hypothetical protein
MDRAHAALPVLMISLVMKDRGSAPAESLAGIASVVVGAAILLFALNVLVNARRG